MNILSQIFVIGLPVNVATYESALERCLELARGDKASAVSAANTHVATAARTSSAFGRVMRSFDLILPDGMPLIWVMNAKLKGQKQPKLDDRVYGPYFMRHAILNAPADTTHYFFGGSQDCLDELAAAVRLMRPDIKIAGMYSPPYRTWSEEDQQEFARKINETAADFVWVALGGEKQESWIIENLHRFDHGVFFAIGDAFELLAGRRNFAPEWVQRHGVTWLYRLIQEPRRMWKRYLKNNSLFLGYLIRDVLWPPAAPMDAEAEDKPVPRVNVLGVGVSSINMAEAVSTLLDARVHDEKGYVCVTGVHGVIESQRDPELKRIHNRSFLTVPDGMPTVWVGREQGYVQMGRVYGPDLMLEVCRQTSALNQRTEVRGQRTASPQACMTNGQEAGPEGPTPRREDEGQRSEDGGQSDNPSTHPASIATDNLRTQITNGMSGSLSPLNPPTEKKCFSHFLYGSTPEVLEKLKANLEKKFPGIQIIGTYSPPFRALTEEEEEELRIIVAQNKPDFFWVGLSTPKQERFMASHDPRLWALGSGHAVSGNGNQQLATDSGAKRYPLDAGILLGVGAAFDIHAGLLKDAPEWIKNSGLQWFYRLCQEPKRLWRRYLDIVPRFLGLTFLQLLGIKKYIIEDES